MALSKINMFAILSLLNGVIGFGGYFLLLPRVPFGFIPSGSSTTGQVAPLFQTLLNYLLYDLAAAAIITVASLFFLSGGFRSLAKVAHEFGTPSKLTLVALVSVPLFFLAIIALLSAFIPLLQAYQSNQTGPPPFLDFSLPVLFLSLLIAAIAALIGEVGGVLLGLWRAGERYDDSLLKAAAICFIIVYPVAPILVLISVHQIRASHQVSTQPKPPANS